MTSYSQQIAALHRAIIEKDFSEMLSYTKLSRHNEISSEERINVYAKGYHVRLEKATITDYKALAHLIGKENLESYIKSFTHQTTSNYWDLNLYPSRFAIFFRTVTDDENAIAVCALEAAISNVYWQPHSPALKAETLMQYDEEAFGKLHFRLRAACQLLSLGADAESYISHFRNGNPLEAVPLNEIYMLVIRPDNEVIRHSLEKEEYLLLKALSEGKSFNDALASIDTPQALMEKLPHYLSAWLERGVFSEIY